MSQKTTQIINSISNEGNGSGMKIYFTVYPSMLLEKINTCTS